MRLTNTALAARQGALRSARYGTGAEIEVHVVNGW